MKRVCFLEKLPNHGNNKKLKFYLFKKLFYDYTVNMLGSKNITE